MCFRSAVDNPILKYQVCNFSLHLFIDAYSPLQMRHLTSLVQIIYPSIVSDARAFKAANPSMSNILYALCITLVIYYNYLCC